MASSIENVISAAAGPGELPPWVAKYAALLHRLREWGLLEEARSIQVARRATGYCLVDALVLLAAYFCRAESVGLREFCRLCKVHGWAQSLAALGDRKALPSSAALSRLLAALRPQNVGQFRERVVGAAAARGRLPVHPLGSFRDSHGELWTVVDLDAVVKAFRSRALPTGEDLPEAQRRSSAMGAPGYPGRKRGQTQISSHRLQQAGTDLWLGQASVAGNTHMAEAVSDTCAWLATWCARNGLDRSRIVVRVDGAGGNEPCAQLVCAAGFRFLARSARYAVLEDPAVRESLQGDVYYRVPSSESGPVRHAAELTPRSRSAPDGPAMRMVVTRFPCAEAGKKSGAGQVIGAAQYELFMTDIPVDAWPAEDAVALYYGRSATENAYARVNQEFGLNRTFSEHRAGQDFAVLVGMLVANLQSELGAQLLDSGGEKPPPQQLRERFARSFDDLPLFRPEPATPENAATGVAPAPTTPPGDAKPADAPSLAQLTALVPLLALQAALTTYPGYRVDPDLGVLCPNDRPMRLHRQGVTAKGATALTFRARRAACAACSLRAGCTSSPASDFQKELYLVTSNDDATQSRPSPKPRLTTALAPQPSHPPVAVPTTEALPPGPYLPLHAVLVPAALRRALARACEPVLLRLQIAAGVQSPDSTPAHFVQNAARLQHRRRTCGERLDWNASPSGRRLTLDWIGGDGLRCLLTDKESCSRAA